MSGDYCLTGWLFTLFLSLCDFEAIALDENAHQS